MKPNMTSLLLSSVMAIGLAGAASVAMADKTPDKPQQYELNETMEQDGLTRNVWMLEPVTTNTEPKPAIIVLHGWGGTGQQLQGWFKGKPGWADDLLVFPDGYKHGWNDDRDPDRPRNKVNDVAFISNVIDDLISNHNADPARIYVVGISNGGGLANLLACKLSDRIAATATMIASLPARVADSCSPKSPMPMLMFNGTDDPLIPYKGSEKKQIDSVPDTARWWARHNDPASYVKNPPVTNLPDKDPHDATTAIRQVFNTNPDTEVVLYSIQGAGHTIPGGTQYLPKWLIGKASHDVDAVPLIYRFLMAHQR